MSAEELIAHAVSLKLDGVVITDHHYQWPQAELDAIARRIGVRDLVVLSAHEVTTLDPRTGHHGGDLLIFGAPPECVQPMWTPYPEVCARAREHSALIIAAHPYREGAGIGDRVLTMDIDGLEVFNQNHSRLDVARARSAVLRSGLLGVAGSDAHRTAQLGQFLMVFERPVRSMPALVAEIRARRYAIQSNRPDIR